MYDLGFDNGALDMTQEAQGTKEKIAQPDVIKIKNICASKEVKRQPQNGTKYFQIMYLVRVLHSESTKNS